MKVLDSTMHFRQSDIRPDEIEQLKREFTISLPSYGDKKRTDLKYELFEHQEDGGLFKFPWSAHRHLVQGTTVDVTLGSREIDSSAPLFSPREGQEEAIRVTEKFLREGYRERGFSGGILCAGCGKGKALLDSEPIVTEDGWVNISDVRVGQRVPGTDGNWYSVTGVYPQEGIREIYKVKFTDGSSLRCDGDHLWTLVKRRNSNQNTVTLSTKELSLSRLKGSAGRIYFLPEVAPVEFKEVRDLLIDPYTLGALLGDGCLSQKGRIFFTTQDKCIIDRFVMPSGYRARALKHQNSGKATTYLLSRSIEDHNRDQGQESLHKSLYFMGLVGRTSHTKFIPEEYKFSSIVSRLSLLQGLFDTDGTPNASGVVEYTTVSKRLLEGVIEIVQSLGGTCSWRKKTTVLNGKEFKSYRALAKLPAGMACFGLKRKQDRIDAVKRQREPYRAVEGVTKTVCGTTTCISVSSPDSLYLARGYIPTHNTVMSSKILLNLKRPTCVLVHKEFLEDQWVVALKETIGSKVSIGRFRRNKKDTGNTHDVVVASTQTITSSKRTMPEEFLRSFGLLVLDEVHRYGADVWQQVLWKFPAAMRLGLTATPGRADGLWPVIYKNIGPVVHELEAEAIDNSVYLVKLRTPVNPNMWNHEWRTKIQARAAMLSVLAEHEGRNKVIAGQIMKAYQKGRRILVISERKVQLEILSKMVADGGADLHDLSLFVGGMKKKEKEEALKKRVIFTTYGMSKEGLDVPALDTLFLALPQSDVTQTLGRIWRDLAGKCHPIAVDFIDVSIDECIGQAYNRLNIYKALGCKVHGDL